MDRKTNTMQNYDKKYSQFASKAVRELRKKEGLTLEKFAKKMGLKAYQLVSKWEKGERTPKVTTLWKMCDVFGYEVTIDRKEGIFFEKKVPKNKSKTIEEKFIKKVEAFLTSDLYLCSRVWGAWDVGTMGEEDFILAKEDEDFVFELAELLYNTANEG